MSYVTGILDADSGDEHKNTECSKFKFSRVLHMSIATKPLTVLSITKECNGRGHKSPSSPRKLRGNHETTMRSGLLR